MKNYLPNKKSEDIPKNLFAGLGKSFFIYAWVFTIFNMLILISSSDNILNFYFNLFSAFVSVNSLIFVVIAGHKIRMNFQYRPHLILNRKMKLFYYGLIILSFRYFVILITIVIIWIDALNMLINDNGRMIFLSLLILISYFYEIITWFSLSSFFKNLKNFVSMKIGIKGFISALILALAAIMQIFTYFSLVLLGANPLMIWLWPMGYPIADIFHYITVSLFIIGFFMLSINLIKEEISLKGEYNRNLKDQPNGIINGKFLKNQINFCKFCGTRIASFMKYCPECGNSLNS